MRGLAACAGMAILSVASAQIVPPPPPTDAPEGVSMAGIPEEPELVPGTETDVVFKDGRRVRGLLIEQSRDRVILSIRGVTTPFSMDGVERVSRVPSVEEQYKLLRDATDAEDIEQIIRLSTWLRDKGRLDLALWEVERALLLEPRHPQAKELKVLIVEQRKVNMARGRTEPDDSGPAGAAPKFSFPVLTNDQINLMRVYEIDLKDPPRLIIPPDVGRRFLNSYAGKDIEGLGTVPSSAEARELFLRQKPADMLAWLFAARARELYPDIRVRENPRSMRVFIRDVHANWLINTCATSTCHGGEEAGRLWLTQRDPRGDQSAYTNFLILERFRTNDGLGLIDYEAPERSPLLDFGLPRDQALFKHPEVAGLGKGRWRPAFAGKDDERYQRALDWIKSMYRPRTAYPVEYEPPRARAAQTPAQPTGPR